MVNQLVGRRFSATDLPPGRVAVMFVTDWCGYCRRFLPHFKQRMRDGFVVDITDESDPLWERYDVEVVPTVLLFEDGEPVQRWAGVLRESDAEAIEKAVRGEPG